MKDETIRPGDLVMVVKPKKCCGRSSILGLFFTVTSIEKELARQSRCRYCGTCKQYDAMLACFGPIDACEIDRLKKIHPPALPETVDAAQEVEA